MNQPLLQVKNLSVDFSSDGTVTQAVKEISFEVAKGKITAIVGESGSGKSVTSLSLMQLLPAQAKISGALLFTRNNGTTIDLLQYPANEINAIRGKDMAMIFQEPMTSLNPVFTCGSQVFEAIRIHQQLSSAEARQKVIGLFKQVNLPDPEIMYSRYPHQLSGGQNNA